MVKHTLKIFQHLLQEFQSVSKHFGILRNQGLGVIAQLTHNLHCSTCPRRHTYVMYVYNARELLSIPS